MADRPEYVISALQDHPSRLNKEAIIRAQAEADNRDFFEGCRLALDPMITFGLKQIPERTGPDGKGVDGVDGAQGSQGEQGPIGTQGESGTPGPQGYQGEPGTQGAQGAQGDIGPPGHDGINGVDGTQGPQGEPGTPGAQGAQGKTGSAAKLNCKKITIDQNYTVVKDDFYIGVNSVNPITITLPTEFECELVIKVEMGPPIGNRKITILRYYG